MGIPSDLPKYYFQYSIRLDALSEAGFQRIQRSMQSNSPPLASYHKLKYTFVQLLFSYC